MHPQMPQLPPGMVMYSNELEDFVAGGGLYPGGVGVVQEICYKLWDYNGTQAPNSNVAVYLNFQPQDGSNDGKAVEIYWNVGPAADMQPTPDGCHLIGTKSGISDNSNWADAYHEFRNACGLERGKLSGPNGIRILTGSQLTLVRREQKKRDDLPEAPQQPGQQQGQNRRPNNKRTILVPTRAKFAWEGGVPQMPGQYAPQPPQMPPQYAQQPPAYVPPAAPAPQYATPPAPTGYVQQPAPAPAYMPPPPPAAMPPAPAPAPAGAPSGVNPAVVLQQILLSKNGQPVPIGALSMEVMNWCKANNIIQTERAAILTALNGPSLTALAQSVGITVTAYSVHL